MFKKLEIIKHIKAEIPEDVKRQLVRSYVAEAWCICFPEHFFTKNDQNILEKRGSFASRGAIAFKLITWRARCQQNKSTGQWQNIMSTVTVENFYGYAFNAITESIKALDDVKTIIEYYGDSKECSIESYFSAQIKGDNLYEQADCQDEDTLIGEVSDFDGIFEDARSSAFCRWFNELVDNADTDDLIELGEEEVTLTPVMDSDMEGNNFVSYIDVAYKEQACDFLDTSMNADGDSLMNKVFTLMNEYCSHNDIKKAAVIAGMTHTYVTDCINDVPDEDNYARYFWRIVKLSYHNYKTVENCKVIDNNGTILTVGNQEQVVHLVEDDRQNSYGFVEFDNDTVVQMDRKECFYVSGESLKSCIEYFLDDVENRGNSTVWGEEIKDDLIRLFPELSERIEEIDSNL